MSAGHEQRVVDAHRAPGLEPLRAFLLSKAMLVGIYQRKAELLAGEWAVELTVAVPTEWRDGPLVRRLERVHTRGYRLIETPIWRSGDFHLHVYPRLGRLLDRARPQLCHIDEEPYNLATFLALRQAARRRVPALFFTWQNLQRRYPPPFNLFERAAYRQAAGAIAGSLGAARVLRAKGYRGPLWVVPQFGVDAQRFRPLEESATAPPAPPRPFTVGFAGRLVDAKGVDLVLEALAAMAPETRLHVLGRGSAKVALAALAERLGVAQRVQWSDWMPSVDMPAYYRSLDVLVLASRSTPSWVEQFGRVLVEAMACGVPCVGSSSGEIPHVLGDAGLVFPEGNADALRACLKRLVADRHLRRQLSEAGRRRVLARFTMEQVAKDTAGIYRRATGRPWPEPLPDLEGPAI